MARMKWRDGVTVVRAGTLQEASTRGKGRATAFNFAGSGGRETWMGTVSMQPRAQTGAHHHGRHEVAIYVTAGRSEIRWGERLEFVADVGPGDFVYFAPEVPHQERNPSASEAVNFVVVRSDSEAIRIDLQGVPQVQPERVF
jgi:uncharacterized RmlC-like cupin family protein